MDFKGFPSSDGSDPGSHCPFLDGQLPFTKVARSLGTFTLSCWADSCVTWPHIAFRP